MENQRRNGCLCCGRRVLRQGAARRNIRSFRMTAAFIANHPFIVMYLRDELHVLEYVDTDQVCYQCLRRAERWYQANLNMGVDAVIENEAAVPEIPQPRFNDQAVQANLSFPITGYSRAPVTTRRCLILNCNNEAISRIDCSFRLDILDNYNYYIPYHTKVCNEHLFSDVWLNIAENIPVRHDFTPRYASDMMKLTKKRCVLNFERLSSINDDYFYFKIGFSKIQFESVLNSTPSITAHFKKPKTALATFLVKLRTGDTNQRLSKLFKMCRKTFENTMSLVRAFLLNEFVPLHLGMNSLPRDQLIQNSSTIANKIFGNPEAPLENRQAITIIDGTYIYLQKSTNFGFQRKSYSLHKFRNLVKPLLLVSPNGRIIDVLGLFEAVKSDATILKEIARDARNPFHEYYRPGDVFILDRGFRDCIPDMELRGYECFMPKTKQPHEQQLSTAHANESRKVTMVRWVIEGINGKLKNKFRLLRNQYFNKAALHLFDEVKIACSLINAFGILYSDHALVHDILDQYDLNLNRENNLAEFVNANNLNRARANFQRLDANIPGLNFPVLTKSDLIILALGTYQLKQAQSYYAEHVKPDGSYNIELHIDIQVERLLNYHINAQEPSLFRCKIQSRHIQSRKYYTYILIDREVDGRDGILGYCCSCLIGRRTLGCCSHIMTILWYLGWARHNMNEVRIPAAYLDLIIRHDVEQEAEEQSEDEYVVGL